MIQGGDFNSILVNFERKIGEGKQNTTLNMQDSEEYRSEERRVEENCIKMFGKTVITLMLIFRCLVTDMVSLCILSSLLRI